MDTAATATVSQPQISFNEALFSITYNGGLLTRACWAEGEYLIHSKNCQVRQFVHPETGFRKLAIADKDGNGCTLDDFILKKIHTEGGRFGRFTPYTPTQEDMLAEDWVKIKELRYGR